MTTRSVVTGAFSYTGKYIAQRLLDAGEEVATLTNHPDRPDPFGGAQYRSFGGRIQAFPYAFDDPARLTESLRGATTLYNTYWVRFSRGDVTFDRAVQNTRTLVEAAKAAGVQRIVHISVSNPEMAQNLPYFRGKLAQEAAVRDSGLSYAILRPTITFGLEDVLVTNIAWLLRRFPVFPVAWGGYRVQPVFVGDVADIAVEAGHTGENATWDVVGPETYVFRDMVRLLARAVGSRARVVPMPPRVVYVFGVLMGLVLRDVLLTWDEIRGLRTSLLTSAEPPRAPTRLSTWLDEHGHALGLRYASEVARHFR